MGQFSAANCLCFQHILHRPPEWLLKCRSDHVTVLPKGIKRPPATWIQLKLLTWFWGCSVWGSPFSQWGQQGHQVQPGRLRTTPGGGGGRRPMTLRDDPQGRPLEVNSGVARRAAASRINLTSGLTTFSLPFPRALSSSIPPRAAPMLVLLSPTPLLSRGPGELPIHSPSS